MSDFEAIVSLEHDLQALQGDHAAVRSRFQDHIRSDFLTRFVSGELQRLVRDPDHIIRRIAGQVNFTLINSAAFDYTIRLALPFAARAHPVKWLGVRQMMSVRGPIGVSIRTLVIPAEINRFVAGVQIEETEIVTLSPGSLLASDNGNQLLDLHEVSAPVILEVLTLHDDTVALHWTFDEQLRSIYAESSRMACSRLRNVLELARRMERPIPESVYDVILHKGNAQARMLGIQSLLMADSASGFRELWDAIDSDDEWLSADAQALFDAVVTRA